MAMPRHRLYDMMRKETKLFVNCIISRVISHQKLKNLEFRGLTKRSSCVLIVRPSYKKETLRRIRHNFFLKMKIAYINIKRRFILLRHMGGLPDDVSEEPVT